MDSADVVIIGAGIIGTATAYFLSRAGVRVCLVDRGPVASGTSSHGEGNVLLCDRPPGPLLDLAKLSVRLWRELAETMRFEYRRRGCLLVSEVPEDVVHLVRWVETMGEQGVEGEMIPGPELRHVEPALAHHVQGGALFPDEAQVQPMRACWSLAKAAEAKGAIVRQGWDVWAIERDRRGRIQRVVTSRGSIATPRVVNAAGPWSPMIGAMVDVEIPVKPRKGHVLVTEPAPFGIHHKVMEVAYTRTVQETVAGVQVAAVVEETEAGSLLLGSSREFVGFDPRVRPEVLEAIASRAIHLFPSLASVNLIRSYVGFRPYSATGRPLIGPVEGVSGFYLATGHEGAGICLGPATGKLLAEAILDQPLTLPLEPYQP